MTVLEPTVPELRATNRALADSVLLTLTGWPVRYGSPEWHALPAEHPHRLVAMQRSAQAWWRYWQPDAVTVRRGAEADRIDRAVAERLREISHDVSGAWVSRGLGRSPSWQELQRRREPWRYTSSVHRKGNPAMDTVHQTNEGATDHPRSLTMQTARQIAHHLHAHGFTAHDGGRRQVFNLAEEAGEFVGAYRRWIGIARRPGTIEDVAAELADVVITTYVTAVEAGVTLDDRGHTQHPTPADPDQAALDVFRAVHRAVNFWPEVQLDALTLRGILHAAQQAAAALDIDLDAAIAAKLDVVFTRGWREPHADGSNGNRRLDTAQTE